MDHITDMVYTVYNLLSMGLGQTSGGLLKMKDWLLIALVVLLFPVWLPFAVIGEVTTLFFKKCKYRKHCKLYSIDNYVCNESGGEFYGAGRYAGCYRSIEDQCKASSYWKE